MNSPIFPMMVHVIRDNRERTEMANPSSSRIVIRQPRSATSSFMYAPTFDSSSKSHVAATISSCRPALVTPEAFARYFATIPPRVENCYFQIRCVLVLSRQ